MIVIHKFPAKSVSLNDLIEACPRLPYDLEIRWMYNSSNELNVVVLDRYHSIENPLKSYLSVHKFQYVVSNQHDCPKPDMTKVDYYALTPLSNPYSNESSPEIVSEFSLSILCVGLLKLQGTFMVNIVNDGSSLRWAASVCCVHGRRPRELQFAFHRFALRYGSEQVWFDFSKKEHSHLLSLPYVTTENQSLVSGFGDKEQAVNQPSESSVIVGTVFNDALGRSLSFTRENWKSSTCCWGAPGYGKTTFLCSLLTQSYLKHNINFLVIEPKYDYRRLKRLIPELEIVPTIRGYNPLIPPRGCNPYEYAEVILDLLSLSTPMPSESPLPDYIRNVYYMAVAEKKYSMKHFLLLYDEMMKEMGFIGEASNFCKAGRNRICSLFRMFCGKDFLSKPFEGFDISRLLNCPSVVEIGRVPTQRMLTVFTYFVVSHLKMAMQGRVEDRITNCLVLEEAHSILSPVINEGLRFELANYLAEGRGRGLSCIICDQSPSRIDCAAANLCGNIVSFRVVSQSDREFVAQQLGVEATVLNDLRKQNILIRTNSMYQPECVQVDVDKSLLSMPPMSNEELKSLILSRHEN